MSNKTKSRTPGYAVRRSALLKRIEERGEHGLSVNIKWCHQLFNKQDQVARDLRRMLKEGYLVSKKDGSIPRSKEGIRRRPGKTITTLFVNRVLNSQ